MESILKLIFAIAILGLSLLMLQDTLEMRSQRLNCEGIYQYSDECK